MSSIISHSLVLIVVLSALLTLASGASYQLWSGSTTCGGSTTATGSGSLSNSITGCLGSSGASGISSVRLACSSTTGYVVQAFSDTACTGANLVTQMSWGTTTTSNNSYPCAAGIGTGTYSATLNCNSAFNLYTVSLPLMLLLSILVTLMI